MSTRTDFFEQPNINLKKNENMRKIHSLRLWGIFEDRFILEERVYWRYMTDEKINIDQKEPVR